MEKVSLDPKKVAWLAIQRVTNGHERAVPNGFGSVVLQNRQVRQADIDPMGKLRQSHTPIQKL
ncbi:hypothetical protein GCM10009824_20160 [Kocuria atrinae]|uniref:Uncharacterized protein n=1 Tax=Kocuria atrinae TaxID=592377 RepID=A0ABN2XXX0_9MICC